MVAAFVSFFGLTISLDSGLVNGLSLILLNLGAGAVVGAESPGLTTLQVGLAGGLLIISVCNVFVVVGLATDAFKFSTCKECISLAKSFPDNYCLLRVYTMRVYLSSCE